MKITTYNPDGSVLKEEDYKIDIPQHIQHFDPKHSFINITKEEMKLINSMEESFGKTVLLDRLVFLVQHDYNNFVKSSFYPYYINDEMELELLSSNSNIKEAMTVVDKFIEHFSGISDYTHFPEPLTNEDLRYIEGDVWIVGLLLKTLTKCKDQGKIIIEEWEYALHLFNDALNNYKNQHTVSTDVSEWIDILHQFCKPVCSVTTSIVFIKSIIPLLLRLHPICRKKVYSLISIADNIQRKNASPLYNMMVNIRVHDKIEKQYHFNLGYDKELNCCEFDLSSSDICTLESSQQELISFHSEISRIFNTFYSRFKDSRATWIQSEVIDRASESGTIQPDWPVFYESTIKSYKQEYLESKRNGTEYQPESCYHYILLLENKKTLDVIEFSPNMLKNLIHVLKNQYSEYQKGLFEGLFSLNYIKEELAKYDKDLPSASILKSNRELSPEEKSKLDIAIRDVRIMVEPILLKNSPDYLYEGNITDKIFLDLLEGILRDTLIYKDFITRTSKDTGRLSLSFHGKFFYNVLGVIMYMPRYLEEECKLKQDYVDKHRIFKPGLSVPDLLRAISNNQVNSNDQKLLNKYNSNDGRYSALNNIEIKRIRNIITKYLT